MPKVLVGHLSPVATSDRVVGSLTPEIFTHQLFNGRPTHTRFGRVSSANIAESKHESDVRGGGGSAAGGGETPIKISYRQDGREIQLADVDSLDKRCSVCVFINHEQTGRG